MDQINTLTELVERAARNGETLAPRFATDRQHGTEWLIIDSTDGQYWFFGDGSVMQVL